MSVPKEFKVPWQDISKYPAGVEKKAREAIRARNIQLLLIYLFVVFVMSLPALMIPTWWGELLWILFFVAVFGIAFYFDCVKISQDGLKVYKDKVFYYNKSEIVYRGRTFPHVITEKGIKAVIMDEAVFEKGETVYCINLGRGRDPVFGISWTEEEDDVQEEFPDI
ncbi:MAG: hypothetical protein II936_10610 [Oscillospiraceae bacterium]|nr:hypothetical protein [Oscillospiraceae bacterium]